jgi:hypothetical protein
MPHSYDYISCFLTRFNILVRLDNLFQRVASINYRLELSSLDQLLEEDSVFLTVFWDWKNDLLARES